MQAGAPEETHPKNASEIAKAASVERFLNKYGALKTRTSYLGQLVLYFRWLKETKGIVLDPDGLIRDNLECVFGSSAIDVKRKRTHRLAR